MSSRSWPPASALAVAAVIVATLEAGALLWLGGGGESWAEAAALAPRLWLAWLAIAIASWPLLVLLRPPATSTLPLFAGLGALAVAANLLNRALPPVRHPASLAVNVALLAAAILWIRIGARGSWLVSARAVVAMGSRRAAVWTLALVAAANAAISLLGWGAERRQLAALPAARQGAPSILLVTFDTVRRDVIGLFGGPAETPVLESLASRGVIFEDHVTQAAWTWASHYSIFNSSYTAVGRGGRHPRAGSNPFLAELLRADGYRTGAFVSGITLKPSFTRTRFGFQTFRADFNFLERLHPRMGQGLLGRGAERLGWLRFTERDGAATNAEALSWLETVGDRPFLLWVHYFDPHQPHRTPPAHAARYHPAAGASPWPLSGQPAKTTGPPAEALARELLAYAYEVHYADALLGQLLAGVGRRGRLDDTIVVATADHGELIGERGSYFRHFDAWEPVARVFAVMAFPGARLRGRIAAQTRGVDLAPTVLDFLGLTAPAGTAGRSLLPLLRGSDESWTSEAYIDGGQVQALRAPPWKYHRWLDGREALYRLDEDPGELHDRCASDAARCAEMRSRLGELPLPRGDEAPRAVDPVLEERLRSLGYLH